MRVPYYSYLSILCVWGIPKITIKDAKQYVRYAHGKYRTVAPLVPTVQNARRHTASCKCAERGRFLHKRYGQVRVVADDEKQRWIQIMFFRRRAKLYDICRGYLKQGPPPCSSPQRWERRFQSIILGHNSPGNLFKLLRSHDSCTIWWRRIKKQHSIGVQRNGRGRRKRRYRNILTMEQSKCKASNCVVFRFVDPQHLDPRTCEPTESR